MLLDLKQMKVTDKRDGHVYDVELLADSTLHMIQPINFDVPKKSWCFNDYAPNCEKYGRLYQWGVNSPSNRSCSTYLPQICPQGWEWYEGGTKGFYAGYRSNDGEFMGFGEVQMYWGLTNPSTMESNHDCDENVYVKEYCKRGSSYCAASYYGNGSTTLFREKATYINCAYGKIKIQVKEGKDAELLQLLQSKLGSFQEIDANQVPAYQDHQYAKELKQMHTIKHAVTFKSGTFVKSIDINVYMAEMSGIKFLFIFG